MKTKNNVIIWSSLICLLPIILSVLLYGELPEQIAIHWNAAGTPDNFVAKPYAAFGLPVFFLVVNLFSAFVLFHDPKRANTSKVMQLFALWTPPVLSLVAVPVTLFIAMGADIPIPLLASVLVGVVLCVCGNYLPKSRQNYTIGIRLPWTLDDADNWNKTHRMAGYLYMLGGILTIVGAFAFRDKGYVMIVFIAVIILAPILYSYMLYRKGSK